MNKQKTEHQLMRAEDRLILATFKKLKKGTAAEAQVFEDCLAMRRFLLTLNKAMKRS